MTQRVLLVFCFFFGACGMGGMACQGPRVQPITLSLQYKPAESSFQSAKGWKIDLEQATLHVEAIRFYEGAPAYAWHDLSRWSLRAWEKRLASVAWAHPGHFEGGSVKAEWIASGALELLGKDVREIGQMSGFSGDYGAAELSFVPSNRVVLRGKATKEGREILFSCDISLEQRSLSGISFAHAISTNAKPVVWEVHLSHWFELIDFSTFVQDEKDASRKRPDGADLNVLRKAVLQSTTYSFYY